MASQLGSRASHLCFRSHLGRFLWSTVVFCMLYRFFHSDKEKTITVPVDVAAQLLNKGYKFLDVRTPEEFSNGHVEGAINIPFMFKEETGMVKNANFVNEVYKQIKKDENVVVGCQGGKRSLMAVNDLIAMGFTGLKDMGGGFTAWIQSGYKMSTD